MNIVISGYGRMGHMIEQVLLEKGIRPIEMSEDITSVDPSVTRKSICIDFTVPDAFIKNYQWIAANFKGVVVGTTGWYDIKEQVFECFERNNTPLIWASNFSLGVNVLTAAAEMVARMLSSDGHYTPYIVEKHHIHKLDAPSGTAKTIGYAIENAMGVAPSMTSVRAGEIPGIHTIVFEGLADRLTLEHEAFSRLPLAQGAVLAAEMIDGLKGVHEFKDLFLKDR